MKNKLPPEFHRGWHLCGAGPARFGYAWRHPCSYEWLAKSKPEALKVAKEKGLL